MIEITTNSSIKVKPYGFTCTRAGEKDILSTPIIFRIFRIPLQQKCEVFSSNSIKVKTRFDLLFFVDPNCIFVYSFPFSFHLQYILITKNRIRTQGAGNGSRFITDQSQGYLISFSAPPSRADSAA